jgi:hypothetical protein
MREVVLEGNVIIAMQHVLVAQVVVVQVTRV